MQLTLISSSFEPIQDQNHFKPRSSSSHSTFHVSPNDSKNQISESHDFEINEEERALSFPRILNPHRNHDSEAILMHKQCDTALSNPMCTELPNVYLSASCSVDHSSSNMHTHTHKTALKQKHTHLDKQTQAERKRIELF